MRIAAYAAISAAALVALTGAVLSQPHPGEFKSLPQFAAIEPPAGVEEAFVVRPEMTIAADGTRTIRLESEDPSVERLLVIAPKQHPTRLAALFGFHG